MQLERPVVAANRTGDEHGIYDALEKGDDHVLTKEEMDVLANEANALIANIEEG